MAQVETFEVSKASYKPLPIVAPDFSYTMDLMVMSALYQDVMRDEEIRSFERRRVNVNNTRFNHGYNYILIFIETTSRKVWVFPQRTKSSRETFKSFTLFRIKVNNKISRLLSDADPALGLIK